MLGGVLKEGEAVGTPKTILGVVFKNLFRLVLKSFRGGLTDSACLTLLRRRKAALELSLP